MQLRLPRRPRISAEEQPTRGAGPDALPADDPWAGEDDAWTADDDTAGEGRSDFVRFFRGAAIGAVAGAAFWALIVLAIVLWLD
jgi:hypothetical protein